MIKVSLIWMAIAWQCACVTSYRFLSCERRYTKVGCFKESQSKHIMKTLAIYDRVGKNRIVWSKFKESLHRLACRCQKKARSLKYDYFSIRYYGECWVGNGTLLLSKGKESKSDTCVGHDYGKCNMTVAEECAGVAGSDFLYKVIIDGGFTEWKAVGPCSRSCGFGYATYQRKCTNPRPGPGGRPCHGPTLKEMHCNKFFCPVDKDYTPWEEVSPCSRSCGGGFKIVQKNCKQQAGDRLQRCFGPRRLRKRCNLASCPEANGNEWEAPNNHQWR